MASRYTQPQLQAMATQALQARAESDPRWLLLLIQLAARVGVDPRRVEQAIVSMAQGNTP